MLNAEINDYLSEGKELVEKEVRRQGRPKGSLSYRTRQMHEQLEELGANPVEFVAGIMLGKPQQGKTIDSPHPFLAHVIEFINSILTIPDQIPSESERERFKSLVAVFMKRAHVSLYEGYVSPELRLKAGITLLEYTHSKRKTIEVVDDQNVIDSNAREVANKYDSLFDNVQEAKLVVGNDGVKIEKTNDDKNE